MHLLPGCFFLSGCSAGSLIIGTDALVVALACAFIHHSVIHELDPYFNFRATKYLADQGFYSFLNWFVDVSPSVTSLLRTQSEPR